MLARDQSMGLLAEYGRGAAWVTHCLAVADSASRLGRALQSRYAIDRRFLWSAALLHDIGRCVTHDPIGHGVEGYNLLMRRGYKEEAFVCASHILFGLDASEAIRFGLPARDFFPRTIEERLVPLVDFMIEGDRITTLDRRFSSLRNRNVKNRFFVDRLGRAQAAARSFMIQISMEIGESVENVIACRGGSSRPARRQLDEKRL
jgi:uncharacterized protein